VEKQMNVLDLIRSKTLKKEHLHDAQFLMAKAYRGVPYVDAHHDHPTPEKPAESVTEQAAAPRPTATGGDMGSADGHMNVLDLIRSKIIKKEHLNDAQFLMAKAYRGVPYVDAHHDEPASEEETRHLTYRGQSYEH
jgi:hypothetical protein